MDGYKRRFFLLHAIGQETAFTCGTGRTQSVSLRPIYGSRNCKQETKRQNKPVIGKSAPVNEKKTATRETKPYVENPNP